MNRYTVIYTSTETLFDEEKQRTRGAMKLEARDEEEAGNKAKSRLEESGRHSRIVIDEVRFEGKRSKLPWVITGIVTALLILSIIFAYAAK
jgi:hypothetical protein